MNEKLKRFVWPRGTVVKIHGLPFYLARSTQVLGLRQNNEEAIRNQYNEQADAKKWARKLR